MTYQAQFEVNLERKTQRSYGPIGTGQILFILDDINMPEVDTYGTQSPHTIVRQHMDYRHWYHRKSWDLKEVCGCVVICDRESHVCAWALRHQRWLTSCVFRSMTLSLRR